jgi:hypothetical protein
MMQIAILSPEVLQASKDKEDLFCARDAEVVQAQVLRNSFEAFIYSYQDHFREISEILPEEKEIIEPLLEGEKEWMNTEYEPSFSLTLFQERIDNFKALLQEKAPRLHDAIAAKKAAREQEQRDAEEAEANRHVTYRDKVKNPKTPKERVDAAITRKEQGNTFFK